MHAERSSALRGDVTARAVILTPAELDTVDTSRADVEALCVNGNGRPIRKQLDRYLRDRHTQSQRERERERERERQRQRQRQRQRRTGERERDRQRSENET